MFSFDESKNMRTFSPARCAVVGVCMYTCDDDEMMMIWVDLD